MRAFTPRPASFFTSCSASGRVLYAASCIVQMPRETGAAASAAAAFGALSSVAGAVFATALGELGADVAAFGAALVVLDVPGFVVVVVVGAPLFDVVPDVVLEAVLDVGRGASAGVLAGTEELDAAIVPDGCALAGGVGAELIAGALLATAELPEVVAAAAGHRVP